MTVWNRRYRAELQSFVQVLEEKPEMVGENLMLCVLKVEPQGLLVLQ